MGVAHSYKLFMEVILISVGSSDQCICFSN